MTARRTNPNPVHFPAHDGPRNPGVDMPPTWSHLCSLCSARLTAGLFTRRLGADHVPRPRGLRWSAGRAEGARR